ncbi:hypothetical protein BDQ17DRAFT_1436279 [Cyathus striatus]|nr:hypothetical protein BDQ17DRAFT_1436279 [Cyathus striatus]
MSKFQSNVVVNSIEEQTAEHQGSEVAATNISSTAHLGDVGQHQGGTEEVPSPLSKPPTVTVVEEDIITPPTFSIDNIDLVVKWGLLDEHAMGIMSNTAKLKNTPLAINPVPSTM